MRQIQVAMAYTNFIVNRALAWAYYGPQIAYCVLGMGVCCIKIAWWTSLASACRALGAGK